MESELDKLINEETAKKSNYDDTQFNDKIDKTKQLLNLKIKNSFYYDNGGPGYANIERLLNQKEILEKISGGGMSNMGGGSITGKASSMWGG